VKPCRIRTYQPDDAERLYEAARESVEDVFPWLPWCHPGYSMAEAIEWVGSRAPLASQGLEYSFAIVGPDGRFLGGCGINQINRFHRFGNLGYWVRSTESGHGIASAAARQVADFAFDRTELGRLEIVCAVGNVRSQRAAERAGAQREGILRRRLLLRGVAIDAVMYSIVRETRLSEADSPDSARGRGRS
jgi:ribosomal-protein-serine acetyltransferase